MKTAATVVQMLIRLAFLALLILGVLFWTGRAQALLLVHVAIGAAFVLLIWVLAYLGMRCSGALGLVGANLIWSLIVLALGMTQTRILPGSAHWIIKVLHLLVGIVAIGLAEALGGRIKRQLRPTDDGAPK